MRLAFFLHLLGLAEEVFRLPQTTCLVYGVGLLRASAHSQKGVAALVGEVDGLLSVVQGVGQIAESNVDLAEVAGGGGGISRVPLGNLDSLVKSLCRSN